MRFGTWPCPRVEVVVRRFRSELGDEIVGGLAESPICRERDGLEVDVKPFVLDDFVGRAVLAVGVDVGGVDRRNKCNCNLDALSGSYIFGRFVST